MEKFQGTYSPPKLSQEATANLNRPITRGEIESVKKTKQNSLKREFPGGLVVRIPGFYYYGLGSIPVEGTEIPSHKPCSTADKSRNKTKFPGSESPGLDNFPGVFHQKYKKELIPILIKLLQKTEEEGILPKSFYEATLTLIPKPDQDI